jgi:predicted regulator of Ras-like GTPase activity (Roadblock/LC7/MglB family)
MRNFSEVISLFQELPDVEGVLILDSDGLTLASSFADKEAHITLSPAFHTLLDGVFKNLNLIGESANQLCFIQDSRVIFAIPVYDLIFVVYSQKKNIAALQSKLYDAATVLQTIAKPEFQTT